MFTISKYSTLPNNIVWCRLKAVVTDCCRADVVAAAEVSCILYVKIIEMH